MASTRAEILSNLRAKTELPLVLDVALPGAAYFSVAAGGLCDVLNLLGEDVVKVDRFVGASGGACSLFLILANDKREAREQTATPAALCPSADLLLQSYLEYAESEGSGTVQRSFNAFWQAVAGVSSFWEDLAPIQHPNGPEIFNASHLPLSQSTSHVRTSIEPFFLKSLPGRQFVLGASAPWLLDPCVSSFSGPRRAMPRRTAPEGTTTSSIILQRGRRLFRHLLPPGKPLQRALPGAYKF